MLPFIPASNRQLQKMPDSPREVLIMVYGDKMEIRLIYAGIISSGTVIVSDEYHLLRKILMLLTVKL